MILLFHIAAGSLALVFGYVALFAPKGARLHRRSGTLFVYAMLAMATAGLMIAVGRNVAPAVNVSAGLLVSYLVVTSLITVRPPAAGSRWLNLAGLAVALTIGVSDLGFAFDALAGGDKENGIPAFPFLLFGAVALLAAAGDLNVVRNGSLPAPSRLARHLWRMCFALLIAALSFFIGQSDEFPEAIRIIPLLALPMLVVLAAMIYWLRRVRAGKPWAPRAG